MRRTDVFLRRTRDRAHAVCVKRSGGYDEMLCATEYRTRTATEVSSALSAFITRNRFRVGSATDTLVSGVYHSSWLLTVTSSTRVSTRTRVRHRRARRHVLLACALTPPTEYERTRCLRRSTPTVARSTLANF